MVNCAVFDCKNYTGKKYFAKKVRYFSFPKEPKLLRAWVKACGLKENINPKIDRICSEHFDESDYRLQDILLDVPVLKRRLKEGAVPSRNIPTTSSPVSERKEDEPARKALIKDAMSSYERSKEEQKAFKATEELTAEADEPAQPSQILLNKEVQTEVDIECARELRIMSLEAEVRRLKAAHKRVLKQCQNQKSEQEQINKIFTPGQIKKLRAPYKKTMWNHEDIASAMSLHSAGPRCYRLLKKRNFPLPSESTLRKWASRLNLKPGRSDISQQVSSHNSVEENVEHFDGLTSSNMLERISRHQFLAICDETTEVDVELLDVQFEELQEDPLGSLGEFSIKKSKVPDATNEPAISNLKKPKKNNSLIR